MICEVCDKTVEDNDLDAHHDDSGDYHYDCYQDLCDKEAAYWAGQYYAHRRTNPVIDAGGYDWGDPKNPEYVEHLLDNAD